MIFNPIRVNCIFAQILTPMKPYNHIKCLFALLIIACIIYAGNANSQNFVWGTSQEIDFEYNPELLNYVTEVNAAGDVYYGGLKTYAENLSGQAYGDNFFAKYDKYGEQKFYKIFAGNCILKNISSDLENNIYLVGMMTSDLTFSPGQTMTFFGTGTTNTFLIKFTQWGDFVWMKNLTELYSLSNRIDGLCTDGANNVYIAYADNTNANSIIRKFTPQGVEVLEIIQTSVPIISSIDVSSDGDIFAAGSCPGSNATFGGIPFNSGFSYSSYVSKYNASGETRWVKFVEDNSCIYPRIRWSPNGEIYFSGRLSGAFDFGSIPTNGPEWVYDFFLAKMDSEGEFVWVREVPETLTGDATVGKLSHLDLDYFGNPYISGFTRNDIAWDDTWQTSVTSRGLIILAYTSDGEIRWVKTANGALDAQSITVFSPDEIYISGTAFGVVQLDDINLSSNSFYFPYLAKVEAVTTGLISDGTPASAIGIYPNPMVDYANVLVENSKGNFEYVEILDLSGNVVRKPEITNRRKFGFSREGLPNGIYFLRAALTDGNQYSKKLVVIN